MSMTIKDLVKKAGVTPDASGSTRCKTPVFRSTYAFVFEPRETPNGDMKYQICMIFPKKNFGDMKGMIQAMANACAKKFGADPEKWSKSLKCPMRDGDGERDGTEYEGGIFVNAGNKGKPGIVDRNLEPLMTTDEFYSGCFARASVSFYGYDKGGNRGVGTGLNNLIFWEDGERLDGSVDASDEFSEFADAKTGSKEEL